MILSSVVYDAAAAVATAISILGDSVVVQRKLSIGTSFLGTIGKIFAISHHLRVF